MAWGDMPPRRSSRAACCTTSPAAITRIPIAWNEIGFGGPASPRGYVRMDFNRRDPWEAVERNGRRSTAMLDDPLRTPRAKDGRAPDVFHRRRLGADARVRR